MLQAAHMLRFVHFCSWVYLVARGQLVDRGVQHLHACQKHAARHTRPAEDSSRCEQADARIMQCVRKCPRPLGGSGPQTVRRLYVTST